MQRGKPFEKGNPGKPKGATNKATKTVKEAVLLAFNALQEDPDHNLHAFAKKDPRTFYQIASKLIPLEVAAKVEGEIKVITGMVIQ